MWLLNNNTSRNWLADVILVGAVGILTVLSVRSNKDDNLVLSKYFSSGVGGDKGFSNS